MNPTISSPIEWSDREVALYVAHTNRFGDGASDPHYVESLIESIALKQASIERRPYGFAIIHQVFKVDPTVRPKVKVLSHYHVEAVEIFKQLAERTDAKRFFAQLVEKYAKTAELRGECFGESRARLFRRLGCITSEKSNQTGVYDLVFPRGTGPS
jgi:hypothetical protein